jgi:hypothetical protein
VVHQGIANSSETKRTIPSRNPRLINEDRINIIYHGINLPIFDEGKIELSSKEKKTKSLLEMLAGW